MEEQAFRPKKADVETVVLTYSNMLFKLCFTMLRSHADAEDAVSEVFLKYMTDAPVFLEEAHRKAWLIRVAANRCKDKLRFRKRRNHLPLEKISEYCRTEESIGVVQAVLELPVKYRTVIYLYYVEGYRTEEIAGLLSISPDAVRKRMQVGREKLRIAYGREEKR